MSNKIQKAVHIALASAALTAASGNVFAANAVSVTNLGALGAGGLAATASSSTTSFTDDAGLNFSAWGHAGTWFNFSTTGGDVKISASANAYATSNYELGMTVYRSNGVWDGGTGGGGINGGLGEGVLSSQGLGNNTPHVFNATDNIGAKGTGWMTSNFYSDSANNGSNGGTGEVAGGIGDNSNLTHTMGYGNSGQAHHAPVTNWSEHIHGGVHTKNGAGSFSSGMTGTAANGMVMLTFANLAAGDYTIFLGGADSSATADSMALSVSQVPLPGAIWMMGTGLIGLLSASRKKNKLTSA